jgi:hypothetical protein
VTTATPSTCPTCGTAVPAGAARCPACGRVFGDANRCPSCNAIAAVRRKGDGYVCVACGKPREVQGDTTVLDRGRAVRLDRAGAPPIEAAGRGALASAMRIAGGLLIVAAIVAGGAAFLGPGAPLALLAVIAAVLGIGGAALFRQAGRAEKQGKVRRDRQLEQRLIALAEKSGGDLVATDVAKALGLGLAEADALLTSVADGARVAVEVDADGIVHYVFREIAAKAPAVSVRVAAEDAAAEAEAIEAEAAARVEKELAKRGRV